MDSTTKGAVAPVKNQGQCVPRGWHSLPRAPSKCLVHRYRRFVADTCCDSLFWSEAACLLTQPCGWVVSVTSYVWMVACFMLYMRSPNLSCCRQAVTVFPSRSASMPRLRVAFRIFLRAYPSSGSEIQLNHRCGIQYPTRWQPAEQ